MSTSSVVLSPNVKHIAGVNPTVHGRSNAAGVARFTTDTWAERRGVKKIDACEPTRVMRAALEAEGVSLPGEEELLGLSLIFNERLAKARARASTSNRSFSERSDGKGVSWMLLFNEVDEDHSGAITFDELSVVVRRKVGLKPHQISEQELRALWCALDADDSDTIKVDEMFKFLQGNIAGLLSQPSTGHAAAATSPRKKKAYQDPDAPEALMGRLKASLAARSKTLVEKEKRCGELQEELRRIKDELHPKRRELREKAEAQKAARRAEREREQSGVGGGGASPPRPARTAKVSKMEVLIRLREALLDIADEELEGRMPVAGGGGDAVVHQFQRAASNANAAAASSAISVGRQLKWQK
jgi:hypothetical protein